MSSASTGGRKYHTTYGKRGGRVLSSGLSSRDWLAAVVAGGNAPATVNKDLYEGHTGYKDSPTFRSNENRENYGYARIDDDPHPPRPSHKSLVDLHVKQLQEEHDAIYAAQLDEALNGKRKISLSSGPESEVELARVSSSRKASPTTSGKTTDGSKKPAVRKAPASRRRIIDLDTPPLARQKAIHAAPVPFPTMAIDASPARRPVTKRQLDDKLFQHAMEMGTSRPTPLARKDSNNASPAKAREAAVEKLERLEKTDMKGKGPATREVFAPMVSKQGSLHPRTSQPIPRSPLKQSSIMSDPLRHLTSTPRVAQLPSSGVKRSSSKAPVNSLRGTHLPPPRGHGSSASAGWRRPLTPSVGKATVPSAQPRKESKSKLDRLIADIVRTDIHGSPLRPKAIQAAGLADRKDASSGAASASSVPAVGKTTSAEVARESPAPAAQDSSSDLSDLTASTSTAASSRRSASSGSHSEGPPSVASDGMTTASADGAPEGSPKSLSADLSSLSKTCMSISPSATSAATPEGVQSFSAFVEWCPLMPGAVPHWSKLGEASYSEVYLVSQPGKKSKGQEQLDGSIVVKIIPLHMPIQAGNDKAESSFDEEEMPQTSFAHDVNREIQITRALAHLSGASKQASAATGFSILQGAYVVKGAYPKPLLECWDTWKRGHREQCQNPRPDSFKEDQLYAVVCLAHGGSDLETVRLKSWSEAASILWQVAESLSRAEREMQFEQRDLHWGNILVAPALDTDRVDMPDTATLTYSSSFDKLPSCFAQAQQSVKATIIDFTLSRATLPNGLGVVSGGFDDETIFDGSGDYQFECYRIMKQLNAADWTAYRPTTNVVWLHYLVQKLLKEKKLKKPSARPVSAATNQVLPGSPVRRWASGRRTRVAAPKKVPASDPSYLAEKHCYEALVAADEILKAAVDAAIEAAELRRMQAAGSTGKLRTRSKHSSASSSEEKDLLFRSASDFVEWWRSE